MNKQDNTLWNGASRRMLLRVGGGWGFFFFVIMGVALLSKSYVHAILGGLVFGLLFGVFMAYTYVPVHVRRTLSIAGVVSDETLANRQRRTIEVSLQPEAAYDLIDSAFADLPGIEKKGGDRNTLTITARVDRVDSYGLSFFKAQGDGITIRVLASVGGARIEIESAPCLSRWLDWAVPDFGSNLQHVEMIVRAIAARIARLRAEEAQARERTELARALTDARLAMLQSQIEPHFLYNTLANAQLLTRNDPARADAMLGHLIHFLRAGLVEEGAQINLNREVARAVAYLEIMKIRMGDRLQYQVAVDSKLGEAPFPSMVLQTLVENSIKHGLEPSPEGGLVRIAATSNADHLVLTVSDNGRGLSAGTSGGGIGLKNCRERLALSHGERASLTLTPNHPTGMVAKVSVPLQSAI